jgi:hypothetical protein
MKIQTLVVSCDEFMYACIIEIYHHSIEPVFNRLLHFFIATHVCSTQKLLQTCEQVKITWIQIRTIGRMGKNVPSKVPAQMLCATGLYFLDDPPPPPITTTKRVADNGVTRSSFCHLLVICLIMY